MTVVGVQGGCKGAMSKGRLVNQRTLRPRLRKLITLITYDHSLKTTLVSVTYMLFKDEQGFDGNDLNALIVLIFGLL